MVSISVRYLFYQPMDERIKTWTLCFPDLKESPYMEKTLFDWPIVLQYEVKAKYRLIFEKFSGMKFFHPRVRLTNQNPREVCIHDEPIKCLFFRSFVVSVSFESFHFKVIRKSLYLLMCNDRNVLFFADKLETYRISPRGWLFLFSHKQETMIISNITHWKSNKLNMGFLSIPNLVPWLIFRAWIVTDQFCWISLHFNLSGRG